MSLFRFATYFTLLLCISVPWADAPAAEPLIKITGVEDDYRKNILAYLELDDEGCATEPWRVRRRFRTADDRIRKALEAYGLYDVQISKTLTIGDDCWAAEFVIDPGQPVIVQKMDFAVTGAARDDPDFAKVLQKPNLTIGQPLRHRDYEQVKRRLRSLASDRGYFDGRFTKAKIEVWPEEYRADLSLKYESGDRYRFGEVTVEQDFLDPGFVSRFIELEPGAPYQSGDLSQAKQWLDGSGYFDSVEVLPEILPNEERVVPVAIRLTPSDRIAYGVGVGFSTDTGPRLRGGYENRRVNRKGHQFTSNLLVSDVLSEVSASYRVPLEFPQVEWLSYNVGVQFEDTNTSESDRYSLGVKRGKVLSWDWIRTDALSLEFDRFAVGSERNRSRLLMPSVGFNQKRADQPINPRRGHRLGFELRGASDWLGSTTSFAQLVASGKYIRELGNKGRVLLRAQAGTTVKESFSELPASVRFFAGGIDSVRGYGYEDLGPEDDAGLVIGGSNLLTGSIEYDRLFYKQFSWAAFIDAGNAFDDGEIDARIGVGVGVKWQSPIGPLRVYIAHPTNYSDRNLRLHISIGPDL